jgi:CRISPR-associated protein Csm4
MKTYEITIKPTSGFGTPIKGDTLFGHVCWQAAYDEGLFGLPLSKLLADYTANPFAVISSAYPKLEDGYALKRPDMPLDKLFDFSNADTADIIRKRKDLKGKRWLLVSKSSRLTNIKAEGLYLSDKELFEKLSISKDAETQRQIRKKGVKSFASDYTQPHNTINRLIGATSEGQFAPYSVDQTVYMPDTELVVFVGLRDDMKIEQVVKAIKQIGYSGFGKDASTGLGKFDVIGYKEIELNTIGSENPNACYTLAPCVPEKDMFSQMFFTPFTRFGRHGDVLAKSGKPFKNPVIMADEGAVFIFKDKALTDKPYIGTAVTNISKAEPNAVTQGYSLYIPMKVEG